MATKMYCDFCKKEVIQDKGDFSVTVFDRKKDEEIFDADACLDCKVRVLKAFSFLKGGKNGRS